MINNDDVERERGLERVFVAGDGVNTHRHRKPNVF